MDLGESETLRENLLGETEDDLEFYITFPTPTGLASDEDSFDFALDPDGSTEPLVFILGWAGSNDRDLSKYSQFYEERGCITVRYSAPGEYILFDTEKIRPLSWKLLDLVSEMSLESSPIFFHCFSNSGATVFQFMKEAMKNDERYKGLDQRVLGQVFDSSPGRRTTSSFLSAFSYIRRPSNNTVYDFILPRLMLVYAILLNFAKHIIALFTFTQLPPCCYEFIQSESFASQSMFIYSKADAVIPVDDVTKVADECERHGNMVTRLCFDDSAHVNHYDEHREVYILNLDRFLKKCIESRSGRPIESCPETEKAV